MVFAQGGRCLIALGISDESSLAVFDVNEGSLLLPPTLIRNQIASKIVVEPNKEEGLEFITVGPQGCFIWWKVEGDEEGENLTLMCQNVEMKEELKEADFVTAAFTPIILQPYGSSIVLLGTANGEIVAYNPKEGKWLDGGTPRQMMSGEVGQIIVRNGQVVVADSWG